MHKPESKGDDPKGHTPLQHAEAELVAAAIAFVQNRGSTGAIKHLYECAYRYTKTLEDGEDPREIIRGLIAHIEQLEAALRETTELAGKRGGT